MTPRLLGFLIALAFGFLIPPLTAEAQPSAKVPRIGWLSQGSPPSAAHPNLEAFREGLRVLGWVEGENLVIEYRWAGIRDDRLPALAAELVRLPVDVIFATPDVAAHAAKHATTTIPIVFRGIPILLAGSSSPGWHGPAGISRD